ncbi:MAG: NADH-quinone oxidoreductase subunit J [Chloroflexi bacterium]|nr:NADH-quinone oxidoreductase subunit J [Chloroflexota bacterium]
MSISQILFLIVGAVTLISAVLVVTMRNLVHAALCLIATLFSIAVLFVLLDAGFMAAVQVVLYIGAIAILIIFAVMLTRRVMADGSEQTNSQWPLGLAIAAAALASVAALLNAPVWPALPSVDTSLSISALGKALASPDGYVVPFQIASVLLTVALVGAIAVAGEKK